MIKFFPSGKPNIPCFFIFSTSYKRQFCKKFSTQLSGSDMESRPPLPPFTLSTAKAKVQAAEDAWNTRDPERVSLAYTEDSGLAKPGRILHRTGKDSRISHPQVEHRTRTIGSKKNCGASPTTVSPLNLSTSITRIRVSGIVPMAMSSGSLLITD
jgi:hypothetical protein